METLAVLSPATGESDMMEEILGTAFFDDDFDDSRSSSGAVEPHDGGEGSHPPYRNTKKVPVGGNNTVLKPKADSLRPGQYFCRRPLMEVYSARFLQFEKQIFEDMYGIILVDGLFPYVIFERLFGDPLRIDSEGYIRLIGPKRVIEAFGSLSLTSCLFNSRVQETPRCHDYPMHEPNYTTFDQFLCEEFITDYPLEVQYVVYRDGAEAILDVFLIDWEGKGECANNEVQIFGTVRTRNNKLSDCEEAQSLLFYKKSEEALHIGHGDIIALPLTRKAAALPLGSTLMVDLCIRHRCSNLFMDGVLVEETVSFDSSLAGEEEKVVSGSRGKIMVKVTWKTEFTRDELRGHW